MRSATGQYCEDAGIEYVPKYLLVQRMPVIDAAQEHLTSNQISCMRTQLLPPFLLFEIALQE